MSSKRLKDVDTFTQKFHEYYGESGVSLSEFIHLSFEVRFRLLSIFSVFFVLMMMILYQSKVSLVTTKERFSHFKSIQPDNVFSVAETDPRIIHWGYLFIYSFLFSFVCTLLFLYLAFKNSLLRKLIWGII